MLQPRLLCSIQMDLSVLKFKGQEGATGLSRSKGNGVSEGASL